MFTKFASYKVPPVMVSTHGSVVPLAMFFAMVLFEVKMIIIGEKWDNKGEKIHVLSVFCP